MLFYSSITLNFFNLTLFVAFLECWVYKTDFLDSLFITLLLIYVCCLNALFSYLAILYTYLISLNITASEFIDKSFDRKKYYLSGRLENLQ